MKITLSKSFLLVGAFLCFSMAQAQEVTGIISDTSGPLPGASVVEKGTTNGTQTDFDGNYTITVGDDATLVISYIGFKTTETAVNGQSTINVTLEVDASQLDEVVVTGYGTQAKKDLTGAVAVIDTDELLSTPATTFAQQLQGNYYQPLQPLSPSNYKVGQRVLALSTMQDQAVRLPYVFVVLVQWATMTRYT